MTTKTYDKDPLGILGDEKPTNDPLGILGEKKNLGGKVGSIAYPELGGETPSTSEDSRLFGYRTLFKDPNAEKGKFIKALPVPKSIESGVAQDKKKDTGALGYIFNSIVEGVARIPGGFADATNAVIDTGEDLIDRAMGTPGLAKARREAGVNSGAIPTRLPEGEKIVEGMQNTFGVNTTYQAPEFDVTDNLQASDVESLAVQSPKQLLDMVYGAFTAGGSFFLQSVSQNSKELSQNPEAAKLSAGERLGYLYTQGVVQAALEKFSLNKILKSTGFSAKATQKITNDIIEEFSKKGVKATAKEIEEAAFKRASSFVTNLRRVGTKGATSAVVEGVTEGTQTAAEQGNKLIFNKISGEEIFNEEDITTNFAKNVINSTAQGGAFGGVVGGGVGVLQNTNKAIRNEISKVQTPEDLQKIQSDIATQVELGNITQEEAEAANITAQQYAEIASKIPQEINAEKKYALIGGIEQREQLKKEIENVTYEMGYLDPAFHEEPQARIELLNAKLEQTNDYIDGLVADKKVTYKKDGDKFFKTTPKGEVLPISKEHYDLGVAIREEEAAKNKKPEVNPQDQKTFRFDHDEDVPTELEGTQPIHVQEINTAEGPKVEATYSGEQLIKAGLAEKEVTAEEMIVEEAKKDGLGAYSKMVRENPALAKDVLIDYAKQKYGLTNDGEDQKGGGRELTKGQDAAVTKAFPTKESAIAALQPVTQETQVSEGAAEAPANVVPSLKDDVEKKMMPITEEMAKVEIEFENNGFTIDVDYDNEIIVQDKKTQEIIDPEDLPNELKQAAANYEKATSKLGEFDEKIFQQSLDKARKNIRGEEAEFEVIPNKQLQPTQTSSNVVTEGGEKAAEPTKETDVTTQLTESETSGGEGTPPVTAPPVAEGTENEDLPERQFTKQMLRSDELSDKSKGEIAKTLNYVTQTNEMSIKEANEIIDYVGLDEAQNVVMNDSGIKPVVRVVLGQILIKKYNELADKATSQADKDYYLDKTIQVANFVTEKLATEAGQQIQAFSLWSRLSPEGQLRAANQDMARQGKEKMRRREKDINKIGDEFQKANEEAADEVTKSEDVQKEVKKEESEKTKKAKDKIQKAKDKREEIKKKRKGKGGNLYSSPIGLTPEGIEFVGDIAKTYLDEGIARLEILVERIIKDIEEVMGKAASDEVKKQIGEIADKELAKADQKLLKSGGVKFNELVKKHYTVVDKTKKSLTQKLMDEMDMSQSNAAALAKKVEDAFDRIATRKKRNILYNEKARFDKINRTLEGSKKPEKKTVADDIIKYSNLGAFENSELKDMLAEKFGLGQISKEQAAKLHELAQKIQKAPEGSPKRDATEDLLAYRAKIKGNDLMETVQGVWYANVLSGYRTHEKNLVSTFFNSMAEIGTEMVKDPKSIPYLVAGYLNGTFQRGRVEAGHTLATGRSPIHIKKIETPSTLERKEFVGGGFNPGNWFKYVTRLMVAEDVLSFQGLKEARARQLARRYAQGEGYNTWTKKGWDRVNQILFHTKERMDEAKLQADEEGLTGAAKSRRVYELMEESRPTKMTEQAYGFAAKGTFNHESEGSLGALTNAVAQALDAVSVGGAKPLRYIVPFTRIITNVVNNSLDYTPVGFIRAARGVRGFRSFEENQYTKGAFKELSSDERKTYIAKAAIGITLAATIEALHLAGIITVTGAGPDDEKKKKQLQQSGWQDYSIKIGDTWISYKYSPLVFVLGFIGNMNDAGEYATKEEDDTFWRRMELAAWRVGGQVADMTWINSASTFLGGLTEKNPDRAATAVSRSLSNTAKGFIPFKGAIDQTTQLYNDIAKAPQKQVNNWWQYMIQDIPIARNSLDNKINALGDPIRRDIDVMISGETKDPVWKFLLDNKGWVAPVNQGTLIVIDKNTQLERPVTNEEYYTFSKTRGEKIRADIEKLMKTPVDIERNSKVVKVKADDLTEAEINKVLSGIEEQATKETKEELFGEKKVDKKENRAVESANKKQNKMFDNK